MEHYIYENSVAEGHKARIHLADCPWCNSGRGIHASTGARNGRWLGLFETLTEATITATRTGGCVSLCKRCAPVWTHCKPRGDVSWRRWDRAG